MSSKRVTTSAGESVVADYTMLVLEAGGLASSSFPLYVQNAPSAPVYTSGLSYASTATWTPAAAAYSANDVMSTAQTLAGIGPAGGGEVFITSTTLQIATTAIISGETSYSLALYNVTPPSAIADNGAWDVPSGDRASFLGLLPLGTPVDLGSTLQVDQDGINRQITIPSGGSLFGYLVTIGGFTATAVARKVTLHTLVP